MITPTTSLRQPTQTSAEEKDQTSSSNSPAASFTSSTLKEAAQRTSSQFFAFIRETFKGLVKIGRSLNNFQSQCIEELGQQQGEKAFQDWLSSSDFGGTRHLAQAAMLLERWYHTLPKKMQRLVVQKANNWSRSALVLLAQQSDYSLVESLIKTGKRTVKAIKSVLEALEPPTKLTLGQQATEADWQLVSSKYNLTDDSLETLKLEALQSAQTNPETGEVIVKTDDIVKALETFEYNTSLILPKLRKAKDSSTSPQQGQMYTQEELQQQIEQAVKDAYVNYEIENKERALAQTQEIREEALRQAQAEIQAVYQIRDQHQKAYQELQVKYQELEQQLTQRDGLVTENQQLTQRIEELEKGLNWANENRWSNTFTDEAAKVVNLELAQQIEPLQQKLEARETQAAEAIAARETAEAQLDKAIEEKEKILQERDQLLETNEGLLDYISRLETLLGETPEAPAIETPLPWDEGNDESNTPTQTTIVADQKLPLELYQLLIERKEQGVEIEIREEYDHWIAYHRLECICAVPVPQNKNDENNLVVRFSEAINRIVAPEILEAISEAAKQGIQISCRSDKNGFWLLFPGEEEEQWHILLNTAVGTIRQFVKTEMQGRSDAETL